MQNQTSESRLDMAARTAEPVVQVQVAECGVEVIAPQQAHDPAAKPDALRIAGRSIQDPLGFRVLIDLLGILGRIRAGWTGFFGGLAVIGLGLRDRRE